MKPKTIKIIYWAVTIFFAGFMLFSGISGMSAQGYEVMKHLGYPIYLSIIIGVAKILGAIAVVQWKFKTIKEWAYAGFMIDFIGASASMLFSGDGLAIALSPLLFLAVMFVSYFLGKKVEMQKAEG